MRRNKVPATPQQASGPKQDARSGLLSCDPGERSAAFVTAGKAPSLVRRRRVGTRRKGKAVTDADLLRFQAMDNIIKRAFIATALIGAAAGVGATPAAADPVGGLPIGGLSGASVDGLGLVGGVADTVGSPGDVGDALNMASNGSAI
ncbi:hypothetical protein [Streptomyces sp. NPDC012508]|uniref:hypothetical protein n=1 Tax=Streptomyces sp. NPDC012508 TaxID=3364837 RepID=UPI0036C74B3A